MDILTLWNGLLIHPIMNLTILAYLARFAISVSPSSS